MAFSSLTVFPFAVFALNNVAAAQNFFVTNIDANFNPDWANITYSVVDVDDDQFLSFNYVFYKRLNHQIMMKFKLDRLEGKVVKKLFQAPKFNYCVLRRVGGTIPVFTDIVKAVEVYGNLIFKCPAEPGRYALNSVPVSKLPMLTLIPAGSYLAVVEMLEENVRSKPVCLVALKIFFTKKK